jgi:hypothetical protein
MKEKYSFKYVVHHVSLSGVEPAWTLNKHNTHLNKYFFYHRSSAEQWIHVFWWRNDGENNYSFKCVFWSWKLANHAPAISSWRFLCWRLRIFTIKTPIQMNIFFLSLVQHRSTDLCSLMLRDYRQKYSFKYVFWSWKLANRGAGLRHVAGCGILLIYSRSKYTFKRPFFSYHRFRIDRRKYYNAKKLAFNQW